MEKEFIPYEQALALKEFGFDEPCLKVGNPNGHTMWKWIEVDGEPPTVNINDVIQVHYDENWIQIPTFSQVFRWFREKYNLQCSTNFYSESLGIKKVPNHYEIQIDYLSNNKWSYFEDITRTIYLTYEEAELACLEKLIEIVKELECLKKLIELVKEKN